MQEHTYKNKKMPRIILETNARLANLGECSQAIEINESFIRLSPMSSIIVRKGDKIAYNKFLIDFKEI